MLTIKTSSQHVSYNKHEFQIFSAFHSFRSWHLDRTEAKGGRVPRELRRIQGRIQNQKDSTEQQKKEGEREKKEKGREGPGVERRKRILLRTSRPTPSECIALTSSYWACRVPCGRRSGDAQNGHKSGSSDPREQEAWVRLTKVRNEKQRERGIFTPRKSTQREKKS